MARTVKKYPIIGGPLDGKYANTKDFYRPYSSATYSQLQGQFFPWVNEYSVFNGANSVGGVTSMVIIHNTLLRPPVRLAQDHPGDA